jgi:hypothetical protein
VSHFNTDLTPNELMEPFYAGANHDVGLALELMADLGWPVSIPTVDAVAPGKVIDLRKTTSTLTGVSLAWTAPGDNGYAGTATTYDLRMSSNPINEGNWASATPLNGEPLPGPVGTSESLSVSGLLCGRAHYFALKTTDAAGNISTLSNLLKAKTQTCPKLIVSPLVLSNAEVGVAYSESFSIAGGVGPYAIQVLSGLPEPAGLTFAAQTVSGTPTEVKIWRLKVLITDQIGSSAKKTIRLRIRKPATILTSSLAVGIAGRSYSATLKASGGKKAYGWALVGGTLPAGLGFDGATGKISGTPAAAASVNLTFQVTDSLGGTAQTTLTLVIN